MNKICAPYKGAKLQDVAQKFGVSPTYYQPEGHVGIDLSPGNGYGKWLVAPQNCIVQTIITDMNFNTDKAPLRRGYGVLLKSIPNPERQFLHWHCLPIFPVKEGDTVLQGQPVAQMGNSGFVLQAGVLVPIDVRTIPPYYGTHDHFEVRVNGQYVDPLEYIDWDIPIKYDLLKTMQGVLNNILNIVWR